MKKISTLLLGAITVTSLAGMTAVPMVAQAASSCSNGTVPLYALVKPDGRHFYTTNRQELAQVAQYNYKFVGTVTTLLAQPIQGTVALKRYYNSATGAHRYFMSNTIDSTKGTFEGDMGYIDPNPPTDTPHSMYYYVNDSRQDVLFSVDDQNLWGYGLTGPDLDGYTRSGTLGWTCGTQNAIGDQFTMYRYYNPRTKHHFLTTSKKEGDNIVKNAGYKYEGLAGYLYANAQNNAGSSTHPVYRLYKASNDDHFYTTNESEKSFLMTQGYSFEGTMGWTSTDGGGEGVQFHRLYSVATGDHLYTIDNNEVARAIQAGYAEESPLGYINPRFNY